MLFFLVLVSFQSKEPRIQFQEEKVQAYKPLAENTSFLRLFNLFEVDQAVVILGTSVPVLHTAGSYSFKTVRTLELS